MKQEEATILIEKVLYEEALPDEFKKLERLIMQDEEVRQLYLDLSSQHALLQRTSAAGQVSSMVPAHELERERSADSIASRSWNAIMPWIAGIAAVFIIAASFWSQHKESQPENTSYFAIITTSHSAKWGTCSLPTSPDTPLNSGSLELLEGTAELELTSGVKVMLESPVSFSITNAMHTKVHYGTAIADVPDGAEGFRMDAPDAEVTDYGTVFAVSVDSHGDSRVNVLSGEVEVFRPDSGIRERLFEDEENAEFTNSIDFPIDAIQRLGLSEGMGIGSTIIGNNDSDHLLPDRLLVKHPKGQDPVSYARKSYLKFDLNSLAPALRHGIDWSAAQLSLTQITSPFGLASFVGDSVFQVYALRDELEWDESIQWETAPGNDVLSSNALDPLQCELVGTFMISQGQQYGQHSVQLQGLGLLVDESRNSLTLIVTRLTKERNHQGLAHAFSGAGRAGEPALIFPAP